jgi:hypothetical protein
VISALQPVVAPPIVPATDPAVTATRPGVTGCVTSQLRLGVTPGSNAAGHIGLTVEFVNTSGRACTLMGYPEVSFQTGSGASAGSPAQPSSAPGTPTLVQLAAQGGTAHADLLLVDVSVYAPGTCRPVTATAITVAIQPGLTGHVAISRQVCSAVGVGVAQVYPVQPGT